VAAQAIIELLAMAAPKGVYQPADIFQEWAMNCYRRAWKQIACDEPYEDPPEDLLRTVWDILDSTTGSSDTPLDGLPNLVASHEGQGTNPTCCTLQAQIPTTWWV
jgi:hypothetical protein